jgi:hypothetical protein
MAYATITILLLFATSLSPAQSSQPPIPKEVRAYLDSAHKGWKLATVVDHLRKRFFSSSKFTPSFAWGDFDQDGSTDYAIQISYTDTMRKRVVLALLNRHQHFVPFVLETNSDDSDIFIFVTKKGTRGYDWGKGKPLRYPCDAIDVIYGGKAGTSYFYRNGAFSKLQTGD